MWLQELNPLWGSILVAIPDFCYIDSVRFSFWAVLSFDTSIATFEVSFISDFSATERDSSGLSEGVGPSFNFACYLLEPPYWWSLTLSPKGKRHASSLILRLLLAVTLSSGNDNSFCLSSCQLDRQAFHLSLLLFHHSLELPEEFTVILYIHAAVLWATNRALI